MKFAEAYVDQKFNDDAVIIDDLLYGEVLLVTDIPPALAVAVRDQLNFAVKAKEVLEQFRLAMHDLDTVLLSEAFGEAEQLLKEVKA